MIVERWTDYARPRLDAKGRLRMFARNITLSSLAITSRPAKGNFIRFLYSHYVFDDQRKDFERAIMALKNIGQFVNTEQAVDIVKGTLPLDGRYFHLSYDDGLHCLLRNAAPILDKEGVPAIVFINSGIIAAQAPEIEDAWRRATNYSGPVAYMDWDDLREIRRAGVEIGAHTRTHKRLSAISGDLDELRQEILGCKLEIEAALGTACRYFAWPFGTKRDIDEPSLGMIRESGYEASFGVYREAVHPGRTDPFQIPRHHWEPQWPLSHVTYFANGGMEA